MNSHLGEAVRFLKSVGIDHPEDDVKLLAAYSARQPLTKALSAPPPEFDHEAELRFRRLVARRGEGREPVAYIVGTEEFMGLELTVSPSVLIPRPSTETLVQKAGPGRFLDVGTGSGAIAIALARQGGSGVATDVSDRALDVARVNAERHGVADRITFMAAVPFPEGPFDFVVSNPPYVTTDEMISLPPEVLHEPSLALEAGADGLDVIRQIVADSRSRAPRLLLECAPAQIDAIRDLALQAGYSTVNVWKDLDGHDRVVEAK